MLNSDSWQRSVNWGAILSRCCGLFARPRLNAIKRLVIMDDPSEDL